MPIPFLSILVVLAFCGLCLWAIGAWPNLDPTIKQIMRIVVIFGVCVWILSLFFPASIPAFRLR